MKILKKTDVKLSEINSKTKGYGLHECYIERWNNYSRYNVILGIFRGEICEARKRAYKETKSAKTEDFNGLKCICTYGTKNGYVTKNNKPF